MIIKHHILDVDQLLVMLKITELHGEGYILIHEDMIQILMEGHIMTLQKKIGQFLMYIFILKISKIIVAVLK